MIDVFTDASCLGNPGPGTWAAILVENNDRQEFKGFEKASTSNRLELIAAIQALRHTPKGTVVSVHTDSQYVARGMGEWIHRWEAKRWISSDKKPVANKDLWLELVKLARERKVTWIWIRRETHPTHNDAHRLASAELGRRIKSLVWENGKCQPQSA